MPQTLHDAVRARDLPAVEQWLHMRSAIELVETKTGYTPLHVACATSDVPLSIVEALVSAGADIHASSEPNEWSETVGTPLSLAVRSGSLEIVQFLIDAGADVGWCDENRYTLATLAGNRGDLDMIRSLVRAGAPLDEVSPWGESALSTLSREGRFDGVAEVLEAGADPAPLEWTAMHRAAALGTVDDLAGVVEDGADLEARDGWARTPFLVAVHAGSVPKAQWLLERGADPVVVGRCGKPPMAYPAARNDVGMIRWLAAYGFEVDATDDFEGTALMHAVEASARDAFHALLELGADPGRENHIGMSLIEMAQEPAMVASLLELAFDPAELDDELLRQLVGLEQTAILDADLASYQSDRVRVFGRSNPERMDKPFWEAMIRCGWTAYQADAQFDNTDASPPATWCHSRYGMSLTPLPDGRFVQIGGEHEDFYDPDFCIYNEVFVYDGKGGITIYGYPKDVFPPTDFHSATLVDDSLYVVGSLGYAGERGAHAQVFRLDLETFAMQRLPTTGDDPGWISQHKARLEEGRIVIEGGHRNEADGYPELQGCYAFDVASASWSRVP